MVIVTGILASGGCGIIPPPSPLKQPVTLQSPVDHNRLWAVAPFANESGVSTVDGARVADAFREELEQVHGIDTVAVNRVLAVMRAANLQAVSTPDQARQLAAMLDVDGIVVGTVTTWDPYPPPTLGMAVQVFGQGPRAQASVDPYALSRAWGSDDVALGQVGSAPASAQATGMFDSRNNQVLAWLEHYAKGRTEPNEAFGSDVYLMNMDLYTRFVTYRLIHDLLVYEHSRMTPTTPR